MILQGLFRGKPPGVGEAAAHLFSPGCLLCGRPAPSDLCTPCFHDLPWNDCACERCALPLPGLSSPVCGACTRSPPHFDAAHAAFRYGWPVDRLLHRFKFGGHLAAGRLLALALAEHLSLERGSQRPDLLVPVPLHHRRLAERGFNQAGEIARALGRALDVPVVHGRLRRTRRTATQRGLDRSARRRNLRDAFIARRRFQGLNVALVDDVITTGSTADAAARAVKRAGAAGVQVYALARA